MPAKDAFHNIVKTALEKEGWFISHDPYPLQAGTLELYIDLGAEKVIAAEKEGRKIAIEIKSFLNPSKITELYAALGQFIIYRLALQEQEPERTLYLAVPITVYNEFFILPFIQAVIKMNQLYLVVYNFEKEVIAEWQN
ncbi:XisH family protein [Dolichospermum circinale]|uniref:XisH family protein n=1 Tax=Dolichospermum circinale TaxID=109265 RepID=UPI0003F7249D|nr:XisH family protein [Dolichospermum circinale]MDB9467996.1 XisH family protein [Dolichospermum circinale CS-539/09]MDB9469983.1 XisH family protein [Dolichospermum circinale CS-539]